MSTKIYEAYCIKPGYDVWEVLWTIRRRAEKNVRATLTRLYNALLEDAKRPPEARELLEGEIDVERFNYLTASRFVQDRYKQTIGNPNRSSWDMSVAVAVRRARRNRCLLIPYPGSGLLSDSLRFLRRHKALADYCYFNNTDRPRHITARAWNERRRTWGELLPDDRWQDKLVLDIVTVEGWFRIDPSWELARKELHARQEAGASVVEAVAQVLPAS